MLFDVCLAAFVERLAITIAVSLVDDVVACRPIIAGFVSRAVIGAIIPMESLLRVCRAGNKAGQRKGTGRNKDPDHQNIPIGAPPVGYSVTLAKMSAGY